jgi:uncharacterized membrane protein YjfL (UPF0719 family)
MNNIWHDKRAQSGGVEFTGSKVVDWMIWCAIAVVILIGMYMMAKYLMNIPI